MVGASLTAALCCAEIAWSCALLRAVILSNSLFLTIDLIGSTALERTKAPFRRNCRKMSLRDECRCRVTARSLQRRQAVDSAREINVAYPQFHIVHSEIHPTQTRRKQERMTLSALGIEFQHFAALAGAPFRFR